MEILNYNKEKESLFVKYSTHTIWEYLKVTEKDYKDILAVKDSDKEIKKILRKLLIVGKHSEVK
jgi:hypothetical protein